MHSTEPTAIRCHEEGCRAMPDSALCAAERAWFILGVYYFFVAAPNITVAHMRDLTSAKMWVEITILIVIFGSHALVNAFFNKHKFDVHLGVISVLCIILALFIIVIQIDWMYTPLLLAVAVVLVFSLSPLCGDFNNAKRVKKEYLKELRRVQSTYTSAQEAQEQVI